MPAALDSWVSALSRFSTWAFAEVAEPAIRYAEEGFVLDRRTALAYELMGIGFKDWPSSAGIYWPSGRPPREGERLRLPDLARTLTRLRDAEKGADREDALKNVRRCFYEGEIAERIVRWVTEGGAWMTMEDLRSFRNEVAPAKSRDYRGWRVSTGDIFCQGPVVLTALSILPGFDLSYLPHNGADYLHLLVEAMKLAFSERERVFGDPNFVPARIDDLLDEDHVGVLRDMIRMDESLPDLATLASSASKPAPSQRKRRDTTNFAIVDGAGNAISCAPSDTIDGNSIVPGLGIMVSPRGVQSRLDPLHPPNPVLEARHRRYAGDLHRHSATLLHVDHDEDRTSDDELAHVFSRPFPDSAVPWIAASRKREGGSLTPRSH